MPMAVATAAAKRGISLQETVSTWSRPAARQLRQSPDDVGRTLQGDLSGLKFTPIAMRMKTALLFTT